jgi:hypothetical protein
VSSLKACSRLGNVTQYDLCEIVILEMLSHSPLLCRKLSWLPVHHSPFA